MRGRVASFALALVLALGMVPSSLGESKNANNVIQFELEQQAVGVSASALFDSQSVQRMVRLEESFLNSLKFDFDGLIPRKVNTNLYASLGRYYESFVDLNESMSKSIKLAFKMTMAEIKAAYPNLRHEIKLDNRVNLSWQALAALYKVYRSDLAEIIEGAVSVSVSVDGAAYTLTVSLPEFDEIADISNQEKWFTARFSYYYLNTYFNEHAQKRDTTYRPLNLRYVKALALPIEERFEMGIKEGWYKARSSGRRRHMGTDIKGAAKSDLYSCTDGTVICTGYDITAGNYVCIVDPSGYEYHYYHMFEVSPFVERGDRVEAGQLIGRMGNTGNSVANHLHLAIVNPNGCHIDPYKVLTQAGYGKYGLLFEEELPVVFKNVIEVLITPA